MKFKHFLPKFFTFFPRASLNWFSGHLSISEKLSPQFCETYKIAPDLAIEYEYSLLKKVAKSTCILKNDIIIDRIMNARMILAKNMYFGKFNSFIPISASFFRNKAYLNDFTFSKRLDYTFLAFGNKSMFFSCPFMYQSCNVLFQILNWILNSTQFALNIYLIFPTV